MDPIFFSTILALLISFHTCFKSDTANYIKLDLAFIPNSPYLNSASCKLTQFSVIKCLIMFKKQCLICFFLVSPIDCQALYDNFKGISTGFYRLNGSTISETLCYLRNNRSSWCICICFIVQCLNLRLSFFNFLFNIL